MNSLHVLLVDSFKDFKEYFSAQLIFIFIQSKFIVVALLKSLCIEFILLVKKVSCLLKKYKYLT